MLENTTVYIEKRGGELRIMYQDEYVVSHDIQISEIPRIKTTLIHWGFESCDTAETIYKLMSTEHSDIQCFANLRQGAFEQKLQRLFKQLGEIVKHKMLENDSE